MKNSIMDAKYGVVIFNKQLKKILNKVKKLANEETLDSKYRSCSSRY